MRLVTTHRLDVAAVGDLDLVAGIDAQLLGQRLADLDELLGLGDRIQPAVLGPVVEVLGEPVGGRRVGNSSAVPNSFMSFLNTRAAGLLIALRLSRCRGSPRSASRTARSARGTGLRPSCRRQQAGHPFGVHDERFHPGFRRYVGAAL